MQTEAIEQSKVIDFCRWKHYPVYAIPNGGRRDPKEAAFLKKSGVMAGVPDLCFPAARRGYHGLYIELKVGRNRPTPAQEEWLARLNNAGYCARVCWGSEEAIETIKWYFSG